MGNRNAPLWVPWAILMAIGITCFLMPAIVEGAVRLGKMTGITSDWAGFAGSIIGAAITLIAAIIAYFAVDRQIRSAERLAFRRDEEALLVFNETLSQIFAQISFIWRIVDWARASDISDDRRAYRSEIATMNFRLLPSPELIGDLRARGQLLPPIQAARFLSIAHWLDYCNSLRETLSQGPRDEPPRSFLNSVVSSAQTFFTGLADAAEAFDPKLASHFKGRERSGRFAMDMQSNLNAAFRGIAAADLHRFGHEDHADTASRQP